MKWHVPCKYMAFKFDRKGGFQYSSAYRNMWNSMEGVSHIPACVQGVDRMAHISIFVWSRAVVMVRSDIIRCFKGFQKDLAFVLSLNIHWMSTHYIVPPFLILPSLPTNSHVVESLKHQLSVYPAWKWKPFWVCCPAAIQVVRHTLNPTIFRPWKASKFLKTCELPSSVWLLWMFILRQSLSSQQFLHELSRILSWSSTGQGHMVMHQKEGKGQAVNWVKMTSRFHHY
jgi:hypothetical protein